MNTALSFDDVLLTPQKSLPSRGDADLTTRLGLSQFSLPIISANMSSVTEDQMAIEMHNAGGLGILHRMCNEEKQKLILREVMSRTIGPYAVSIESGSQGIKRLEKIIEVTHNLIVNIDIAHAYSDDVVNTIKKIYNTFGPTTLIVGNIATPDAADYIMSGIEPIIHNDNQYIYFKIGVGSGSQCSTRIVTGCGLPTFESLWRFKNHTTKYNIIADGGIKNSGDIVKCLAAGANMVMLGSLLAGTKQAPGEVIKHHGELYKVYRGSASFGQQTEYSHKEGEVKYVEGEETLVPYKGDVFPILKQLEEGIKSGFSYCGARNLQELQSTAEFVQITNSGFKESQPHGAL